MKTWYGNTLMGLLVLGLVIAGLRTPRAHTQRPPNTSETEQFFQDVPNRVPISTNTIRVPILIYHNIRPDYDGETQNVKDFTVTPKQLDEQLEYLARHGYTTISLDQLAAGIKAGTTSPILKPIVLTFDDGWKNEFVYGFPILQKYHMTATFFIFTNPIGKHPHYFTWEEVRELDAAGMTIGAHTLTHPLLSRLSPEQLRKEIVGSKKILEEHLGKPVTHFASPFGYTNDSLVALLKETGFTTGRTTYRGSLHSNDDIYRLTGFLVHRNMKEFIYTLEHQK